MGDNQTSRNTKQITKRNFKLIHEAHPVTTQNICRSRTDFNVCRNDHKTDDCRYGEIDSERITRDPGIGKLKKQFNRKPNHPKDEYQQSRIRVQHHCLQFYPNRCPNTDLVNETINLRIKI